MNKGYSKLAVISVVFGAIGILFGFVRVGLLPAVGIPLGFAALLTGAAALWAIKRSKRLNRGRGLAILGGLMGMAAILISFVVLAGMVMRQVEPMRQRQNRESQMQVRLSRNPMPSEPTTNFTSNLPIIILRTDGRSQYMSRNAQTVARAQIFDVQNGRASDQGKPEYEGLVTMHPRGSSTLRQPKRSYTLHTVDNETNQTKAALLGLPKGEDWVLYAPFEDKTMIRDVLAFQLAAKMGHYAPRTRYVELFIKAASSAEAISMRDYAGVYVLMEKIKRGKDRVDIAKLEPEDRAEPEITGGYIVKRDHSDRSANGFRTRHGGPYYYVYPTAEKITSEQRAWLTRYFNSFESALHSPDFRNPKTGYAAYLDVDSFIDAHLLIELGKNVDGFRYSSFLTKDRGGKLKTEPPWDWNRSFGNANYYDGWKTDGWYSSNLRPNEISWHERLQEDPAFTRRLSERWIQLRHSVFDPKVINATIDELASQLEEAQARNFERWPILGTRLDCNFYVGQSYQDEVRWLKKWIERRIAWIDSEVGAPPLL